MNKTRKLLSIVMAVMMLLGCCGLSSFAIDWPAELEAGAVTLRGLSTVASVEIPVSAEFTEVATDAVFTVYYSAEAEEDIFDVLNREEVGTVGAGDAYLKNGVLHINLAGLDLAKEGYYYVTVGSGALTGVECYNIAETTDGVQYKFASLELFDKISAIFGYVLSVISNMISNGAAY